MGMAEPCGASFHVPIGHLNVFLGKRECITLTEDQEQDLAQLKHKLQEVGKVSVLLKQHFQDVLSRDDPDNYQGQALKPLR
ncbi:Neuroblastoma breakpoint family member 3 [Manis javanica]|nr:Neuroblastoma breakpoint family member 3 [Manis javanica]